MNDKNILIIYSMLALIVVLTSMGFLAPAVAVSETPVESIAKENLYLEVDEETNTCFGREKAIKIMDLSFTNDYFLTMQMRKPSYTVCVKTSEGISSAFFNANVVIDEEPAGKEFQYNRVFDVAPKKTITGELRVQSQCNYKQLKPVRNESPPPAMNSVVDANELIIVKHDEERYVDCYELTPSDEKRATIIPLE